MRTLAVNALRMAGKRTALGRLIEYLAQEWSRTTIPFDRVVLMSPRPLELPSLAENTPVHCHAFGEKLPLVVWEQLALQRRARDAALLFCPTYNAPLGHDGRLVVANHGIYERLPDEFPRLARLRTTPLHRMSARKADRVIANSNQTKRDIIEFFDVAAEQIDVVYPAAAELFFGNHDPNAIQIEVGRHLGGDVPYFIFVGKLSRRRNVPNLIQAFAAVRRERRLPHKLLIVGPNTTNTNVPALAALHSVGDAVVHVDHLDQESLALLYTGATAFVLPTTYEGISYTMFEAMASGTAVMTVDHPTLAEAAREAVLAAPTPMVADLAAALGRLVDDPSLRDELAGRGRAVARRFSWTANAAATMEVLDRVAAARDRRN